MRITIFVLLLLIFGTDCDTILNSSDYVSQNNSTPLSGSQNGTNLNQIQLELKSLENSLNNDGGVINNTNLSTINISSLPLTSNSGNSEQSSTNTTTITNNNINKSQNATISGCSSDNECQKIYASYVSAGLSIFCDSAIGICNYK